MQKLLENYKEYKSDLSSSQLDRIRQLAKGQKPEYLFISCSDSRVMPNLFTKSEPGSLFELQNAGNIIPAYGAEAGRGMVATIDYAVSVLEVKNIIICGHTFCGAMQALFDPEALNKLPDVAKWLEHSEVARRIAHNEVQDGDKIKLTRAAVEANVVVQMNNIATHPSVARAIACNSIDLNGWVYDLETTDILVYDKTHKKFAEA